MVGQQAILDALKQIGLNLYERKLWVALLSRGTSTAGELSSLARVPHSRTYDVLESLADKGFVMIQPTKPLKYIAVAPNEALERAKKKLKENTNAMIDSITRIQNSQILKDLEKLYKKGFTLLEPGEMTGSLKGRDAMYQQLETIFKNAKNSIFILTTSKNLADLHSIHGDALKKAFERGVKIRIAASYEKNNPVVEKLKSFAEVRKISKPDIVGRFFVVDDSHLVMALTDEEEVHPTQDLALWSQSEHVAGDVLKPIFDLMWQKLEPA